MSNSDVIDLLCPKRCYDELVDRLWDGQLECPNGHPLPPDQAPHNRDNAPRVSYRCRKCGAVFNLFTGTSWCNTHHACKTVLLILRGFEKGYSACELADVLDIDYSALYRRKQKLERCAEQGMATGFRSDVPPWNQDKNRDESASF
jgi:hypothetical protein